MKSNNSIGVIDIGSNSVHLVVGHYHEKGYFTILDDVKVNVRLCEGLSETGLLSPSRMDLGVETLGLFKRMCDTYQTESVIAVATAAVRKADNGPEFCKRVAKEVGIDISVIPGESEATYDYLGVVNTIAVKDALMMDIGGGSVEFVLIKDRKKKDAISLPFGSIDLAEQFGLADTVHPEALGRLKAYMDGAFSQYQLFKKARGLPVIGVGGTIRNLGRIHRRMVDYPLEIAHNYPMTAQEVKAVCDLTAGMNLEERRNLKGLSKGRSDIFVGASQAVRRVMKAIGASQLIIADAGLRDGILYDQLGYGEGKLVPDVYDYSLANVLVNYDVNIPHAYHLYKLSLKMFEELKPLHRIDGDVGRIIKTSALLHDSGIKIQYTNHHEHSFYLILNSGLYGLTHKELLMSAFSALNHRTNKKVKVDAAYEAMLSGKDKAVIDTVSLFLQIGEYLDRSMDGVVEDIRCEMTKDTVTMHVISREHTVFADMVMQECGKKFNRVLGRELRVLNDVVAVE